MGRCLSSINTLKFLRTVGRLKSLKRTGWLLHGLPPAQVESVADHTMRTSVAALILGTGHGESADTARVAKMALVHDLAEALVGDITPLDGVSAVEKYQRERRALHDMVRDLPSDTAREIVELWEEFEAGVSADAALVRDIDKLELLMQADEYEAGAGDGIDLQSFFDSTQGVFRTEEVRSVVDELREQRDARRAGVPISTAADGDVSATADADTNVAVEK